MKRLAVLALALVCAAPAFAQNWTTVTATNITDPGAAAPTPLAAGSLCFLATDSNDRPISFQVGGGGQTLTNEVCQSIANGALSGTLMVPNPANTVPAGVLYRIRIHEKRGDTLLYRKVAFTGTTFNFDNYQPVQSTTPITGQSVNGPLTVSGNLTITGSCTGCGTGGGGGGGYATIANAASNLTQRALLNWTADIVCSDNSGSTRTDCALATLGTAGTYTKVTTDTKGRVSAGARAASIDLGDFSTTAPTTAGKIPIYDPSAANAAGGTGAYVPGDPLVQGLFGDGSTSVGNPVVIGGYDAAGTPAVHRSIFLNANPAGSEYGLVTRNIPSGTQTVSGTLTANLGTTNGLAQDTTVSGLQVAQGSTTSGQKGGLMQGAVTTAGPSYTTGQTAPFSLDTFGAVRVSIFEPTTLPVLESTLDGAISGSKLATKSADGDFATIGTKTDAAATQTDATSVSAIALLKEISKMLQAPASTPVTGTFWQATQPVSESTLDGAISGSKVATKSADGDFATIGTKTDAAATQTDTTAVSMIGLMKEVSKMLQAPASTPVTGTFWQATQPVSAASLPLPSNAAQETGGNLATIAGATGSTGSTVPTKADYMGAQNSGGMTGMIACDKSAAINVSASGYSELVAGVSSKKVYVCGYNFQSNGAVNVKLSTGTKTTTACDTSAADLTGAYPEVAQTGISDPGIFWRGMTSIASGELCINLSAAVQTSGVVYYAQF